MPFGLGPRRGVYVDIAQELKRGTPPLSMEEWGQFEKLDLLYRSLCALLYNYVPTSGHPGGSISSGRFVAGLLFDAMDYDVSDPDRDDADLISYAAGHKALGLYAMWALRNEILRVGAPELLPKDERRQLRLEDLIGFRRNPVTATPLFTKLHAKALDGHPTPATPFIRLSTGASGVGLAASIGLAFAAADAYGEAAPRVHIVEGEGGMTPGRVAEALAAAGTASLSNAILHVDWNQSSIDTDRVCRDGATPGEYVQWTPAELCYLHDWNVVAVSDGMDLQQVIAAQRRVRQLSGTQPTAVIYRTVKGWQYGMEGRASHGSGHKLCSEGFYQALAPLLKQWGGSLPTCEANDRRCGKGGDDRAIMEECLWEALSVVRTAIERSSTTRLLALRLKAARDRLAQLARTPRAKGPRVEAVYEVAERGLRTVPPELLLKAGATTTLRGELGRALNHFNRMSDGALLTGSADLLGSTSANLVAEGFPKGYYNARTNADARLLAVGGICEDAMCGIAAGVSAFGRHVGVAASYAAFVAALGHVAARLHAIGNQARVVHMGGAGRSFIMLCAHAGLMTGEDGPTHADPQALQLLQENFPRGAMITLTPWDPAEIWPLLSTALLKRPAIIAPFVTRPTVKVLDRAALRLAPAHDAAQGTYCLRAAAGKGDGTVVLQESGVTYAFLTEAWPRLVKEGVDLNLYYVASAELFDLMPPAEQARIFPEAHAQEAMGITGFTAATMFRWVRSDAGRAQTLCPFMKGHYLGSGQAELLLAEAGLDGESQFKSVMRYVKERRS